MDIMRNQKFIIQPHFRLQEWVAEEKGYFKDEGLDYEFRELVQSTDGQHHYKGDKVGAFQSLEKGRTANVSCACHCTVDVAASKGHGKLYPEVYSVAPSGVFVAIVFFMSGCGTPMSKLTVVTRRTCVVPVMARCVRAVPSA